MGNVIATWSGGKDSCFAAYQAMQRGYHVKYLANTISKKYKRVGFHGVKYTVMQQQAEAVGIPLLQIETTGEDYTKKFKENLKKGLSKDIAGVVFGDIHLTECFLWSNNICKDLHLATIEPLWQRKTEDILEEFINVGFKAMILSTQGNLLGKEWVGRVIDKEFLRDIKKLKTVDLCGENGEYHTLVLDGPLFKKKIEITKSDKVLRDGYWFLDIQKYHLQEKA